MHLFFVAFGENRSLLLLLLLLFSLTNPLITAEEKEDVLLRAQNFVFRDDRIEVM